ncbi:hypothetical protein M8J77_005461 [Diaphorina citri]|nr:hypothetical protein M8J77_005461 [Diaphorina citri]
MCNSQSETIQHITTGCTVLAGTQYLQRHDKSCNIIHLHLAKKDRHKIQEEPYYKYKPETVLDNEKSTIYWNKTIQTEAFTQHNKPDIVYIDKTTKLGYIIDMAHPADHNLQQKETEKITKYLPLVAEMKTLYRLNKVSIIPIIVSANGLISKQTTTAAWKLQIPRRVIYKVQQNTIIETCSIVRKVLNTNI